MFERMQNSGNQHVQMFLFTLFQDGPVSGLRNVRHCARRKRDEKSAMNNENGSDQDGGRHPSPDMDGPSPNMDEFVQLLAANQKRVYIYLCSLLPGARDVDDLFQETSLVCWREFHRFTPGTNFGAWACTIAFNRVRAWRKKRSSDSLVFSDEFLTAISSELIEHDDVFVDRMDALESCVEKLPQHHRQLLKQRYTAEESIETLAEQLDRSTDAVYRMLSRIRATLHSCVSRTLQAGETS